MEEVERDLTGFRKPAIFCLGVHSAGVWLGEDLLAEPVSGSPTIGTRPLQTREASP